MLDRLSANTRLIVACVISTIIITIWQFFFVEPMVREQAEEQARQEAVKPKPVVHAIESLRPRDEIIAEEMASSTRVVFENAAVKGSINLIGLRLDDLILKKYRTDQNKETVSDFTSANSVVLLSPSKAKDGYFIESGWVSGDSKTDLPGSGTIWKADKTSIKAGDVLTLTHTNRNGVKFKVQLTLDENYLFSVVKEVENNTSEVLNLASYTLANRINNYIDQGNYVFHEGFIGVKGEKLSEEGYSDLFKDKENDRGDFSWVGLTDKYWLTAFWEDDGSADNVISTSSIKNKVERLQLSSSAQTIQISPNAKHVWKNSIFAGAKELDVLEEYQQKYSLPLFDRVVDFGYLYFITKPLLSFLHFLYKYLGNFGVAIMVLTVIIKIVLFPLAHKGYKGMNRLKDLQPKIAALKERHESNPSEFQKALLDLYKKEKINPMGGCLPILLQIPVFFALYKVLYVSIEMRHAPFFGWIKDLSVPDPSSIFNLFGLIPWDPPQFLMIGILPCLMAFTMYVQQRMNPEPTDPVQAKVMRYLPLIFLFMFSSFPSGLIVYWTLSNVLSIMQQFLIKKLEGHPIKTKK